MKAILFAVVFVVSFVASTSWAVDAKGCGDAVVAKAKALKVLGAGGEDMARGICHDLKQADRDTFASCAQSAGSKQAIEACMKTAGRKAMGR